MTWKELPNERRLEVLSKAEKLLALGQSENEGESSNAMRFLGDLLAKYSLSMGDLNTGKTGLDPIGEMRIKGKSGRRVSWECQLAMGVASVFDGNVVTSRYTRSWELVFIAAHNDLPMIEHFFNYLRKLISVEKKNYVYLLGDIKSQNAFAMGMTASVTSRLKNVYGYKIQAMSESRELVPVLKGLVKKKTEELFPKLVKSNMQGGRGSNNAYWKGFTEGKNVSLHRPITGDGPGQIER